MEKATSRAQSAKKKRVMPHMLHHSFATQLIDAGSGLRSIQAMLDHNSTKIAEIYTPIAIDSFRNIKA